jgi:hypothetical protein
VAFIALACAAVLPYDQVKASAELTGGSGSDKPFPSKEQIAERLQSTGPSGSDPKPHLEQLRIPARWLYFTVVTFPDSGHGLLHSLPPTPKHRRSSSSGWKEDPHGKPSVRSSGR